MTHSQVLGKVESGGGPIFKVVLECQKVAKNTQILKIAKFAM